MTIIDPTPVSLRIWCDLASRASGGSPVEASSVVSEFAILSDGQDVPIVTNLGWTAWPSDEYWAKLTRAALERDISNALLPEDAEATGEAQDWAAHSRHLNQLGVHATPQTLQKLPHQLEVSERLARNLRPALDR